MTENQLKKRTKKLAVDTAKLIASLSRTKTADVYGMQLIRSSSSVGCNYRAACRARSDAEMAAKMGISEEEADESQYWLELLGESGDLTAERARPLHREFNEIVAILVASRRTLRSRIREHGSVVRDTVKVYNTNKVSKTSSGRTSKGKK